MEKTIRSCGCKGCRTCLLCETEYGIKRKDFIDLYKDFDSYSFCPKCNKIYKGWDPIKVLENHLNHKENDGIHFPGVYVHLDFITDTEENVLIKGMDESAWTDSQSGRRKQNYGPKTNFKKMKLSCGQFNGFPVYSKFVQEKFTKIPILKNYQTIEQCSLEYDPNKGASIDPHIDDCWIWGERVVTVNCLSDSVLTLAKYIGDDKRYNLSLVKLYENELIESLWDETTLNSFGKKIIRIAMPRKSLIVLYGSPRYQWEHSVLREDILERRVCIAYREFTPLYLENGKKHNEAAKLTLVQAQQYWDHSVDLLE